MVIVVVGASTGRIIYGPSHHDRVPSGIITNVPITKFLHKSFRSLARFLAHCLSLGTSEVQQALQSSSRRDGRGRGRTCLVWKGWIGASAAPPRAKARWIRSFTRRAGPWQSRNTAGQISGAENRTFRTRGSASGPRPPHAPRAYHVTEQFLMRRRRKYGHFVTGHIHAHTPPPPPPPPPLQTTTARAVC